MSFTPLEEAVIQALGWDLRDVAPDLAGQFEDSLPGARRNTGAGLYTEMIVDPHRPPPKHTPSGSFGTVHAMVGDLPGSMAFKVRLREGVLMGLEGDAFDMDTSAIDFRTTPFDRVFTVDSQGRSIAFDPAVLLKPSPLLDLQTWDDPERGAVVEPQLVNVGALQRVQDVALERYRTFPKEARQAPELTPNQLRLIVLLLFGLFIALSIPVLFFRLPFFAMIFVLIGAGRLFQNLTVLNWIQDRIDALKQASARR
ncbi:MAG: hypothetical protein EBR82_09085 [Caulobacteraceae bacterium]|nr:hypothetical protein [Caulobacteraceae bacterium]